MTNPRNASTQRTALRGYRNWRGMTLIEVLVVIVILMTLVSMLLPALGKARHTALVTFDRSNLQQVSAGILSYAADNNGMAPPLGGYGQGDVPYVGEFGAVAGPGVFGIKPRVSGNFGPNYTLGLGSLLTKGALAQGNQADQEFGNYLSVDALFSPFDRGPTRQEGGLTFASWWELRDWFGDSNSGASWNKDSAATQSVPGGSSSWGYYMAGSNYHFQVSYAWRGADYNWYDPSINTLRTLSHQQESFTSNVVTGGGTLPVGDARTQANMVRANTAHQDFANHAILMNKSLTMLDPANPGANVLFGDGSAGFQDDPDWINSIATNSPGNWYAYYATYFHSTEFAMLDYYLGND